MKFIALILLFLSFAHAEDFTLKEIDVNCPKSDLCEQRKTRFTNLKGDYRGVLHLKNTLRIMASDGGYQSFSYDLFRDGQDYILKINFILKPIIDSIDVGFVDRNLEIEPTQLVSLKEGEFFEDQRLKETSDNLRKRLEAMGYPHNAHTYEVVEKDNRVHINFAVTLGTPRIFKSLKTNSKSEFINDFLRRKFLGQYNKPFDITRFKNELDNAQKELFTYGYYLLSMEFTPEVKSERVTLDIKVTDDQLIAYDFKGLNRESRDSILTVLTDLLKQYKRPLSDSTLKEALFEYYRKKALLNTTIKIQSSTFINRFNETVNLYRMFINEGLKTKVAHVNFVGNTVFSKSKIEKMFHKEAFELASANFYDEEYLDYFSGYLRNQYLQRGYVQVRIQGPLKTFDKQNEIASVEYVVTEGRQAVIKEFKLSNLDPEIGRELQNNLTNQQGRAFNPIALVDDIKKITSALKEKGYYFAEITNANEENVVTYSKNGDEVFIDFHVNAGIMIRLNRVLFLGNDKTRKKVIQKKVRLDQGEIITPSVTRDIEAALSATGLFNSVNVTPVAHSSSNELTDLVVKVTEREYGLIEFAPGYRTDIGLKLTGTASYMNIGGLNQSLTLRTQVNQRFNYVTFDPRRRREHKRLLEYNNSLTYNISDIFDSLVDVGIGGSVQRKRFYSFDADIQRANTTFTRDISKKFSTSLRYQLEKITQWDATQSRDNGSFVIGALTPSVTWDLRNSQILPVKGAFFNLSNEFANPFFLSEKKKDLTIDYYKLVSRNRFYIPYKKGTVAISLVAGMQENLAKNEVRQNGAPVYIDGVKQTEGYIPNIKVFRLTGMDIVRGFNDEEINRLPDGRDISQARVQNRAYLANFKFEPRYFINDNFITGLFYDAGRVYVDQVNLGELRDSVGITFKILTPVGTLDFDYGIKLLRKRNQDGSLEDPGRFHVSIGFF